MRPAVSSWLVLEGVDIIGARISFRTWIWAKFRLRFWRPDSPEVVETSKQLAILRIRFFRGLVVGRSGFNFFRRRVFKTSLEMTNPSFPLFCSEHTNTTAYTWLDNFTTQLVFKFSPNIFFFLCWSQDRRCHFVSLPVSFSTLFLSLLFFLQRGKFFPQLTNLVRINTPKAVQSESRKAFRKLPNVEQAIATLTNLKGVGTTLASGWTPILRPVLVVILGCVVDLRCCDSTTRVFLPKLFSLSLHQTTQRDHPTKQQQSYFATV